MTRAWKPIPSAARPGSTRRARIRPRALSAFAVLMMTVFAACGGGGDGGGDPTPPVTEHTVRVETSLFFSTAANTTAALTFHNRASGTTYQASPNSQGIATLRLPQGAYDLDVDDPAHSELHRMGPATYADRTLCQVSDYTDRPFELSLGQDTTLRIETVDDARVLRDMATQWGPEPAAPLPGRGERIVAIYRGNTSGDTVGYPPGGVLTDEELDVYRTWAERLRRGAFDLTATTCDNPIRWYLGIADQPWLVEQGFIRSWAGGVIVPEEGLFLFYKSAYDTAGITLSDRAPIQTLSGIATLQEPITAPDLTAKLLYYGSLQKSDPPICSIRDASPMPGCDYDVPLTPNDSKFYRIVPAFVAPAIGRGFNPRIVP